MKLMEPYRTSDELKTAYNEVMRLCAKHKMVRALFFDLWAESQNQRMALSDSRLIDTWLKTIEKRGMMAARTMDALIDQEIEEYPFRANCWRYEI